MIRDILDDVIFRDIERYLRLMRWAMARYARNEDQINPRLFAIERMAAATYLRGFHQ
jgi:hypothetical protein